MPKGNRFFIEPRDTGWALTLSGRMVRRFDTKAEALGEGVKRAKAAEGQLVIKGPDGKIQSERTYGHDLFPPAG